MSTHQTTSHNDRTIEEVVFRMEGMEQNLTRILSLLAGNSLDRNDSGVVGQMAQLKARVEKLEKWKDKAVYTIIGLAFGAGWGISDLLSKIFNR